VDGATVTIRNLDNYVNSLWDWGFLDECFGGTRIKVTDMDGLVERNHHYLMIEAKGPGVEIPKGQRILFDNLHADFGDRFHILVVWGEPNKPEAYQIWGHSRHQADIATIQMIVRRWFAFANRQPRNKGE
jgi:hypothetical protein